MTIPEVPPPETPIHDHLVHEAVGGPLTGREAGATLAVGVNSLLVLGVLPVLLGDLAAEHRLTASGIGVTAMLEALCMGVTTGLMGLIRRPSRLRLIAVSASLGLAAVDLAGLGAAGPLLMALRAMAGAVEGVLLWITVAMIARTVTPERWAGAFFTSQTVAQLALALALSQFISPRFGANGALVAIALASVAGVIPSLMIPGTFAPLAVKPGESEAPPPRGWVALIATGVFVSAAGAVGVYLEPLAVQAGLDANVARLSVSVSLAGQVAGGVLATSLAGRVRYFTVFVATSGVYLGVWAVMGFSAPAWLFIGANALAGLFGLFLAPFLVPMTIDADPSRRTAMQSGAAQLLGGAMGPLLASQVVGDRDSHGVLWLGAGLLLTGLAAIAALRFTARPAAQT